MTWLRSPWVLGGAAVVLVLGVLLWRHNQRAQAVAAAAAAQPSQPGLSGMALSTDNMALNQQALQQELGQLLTAVSSTPPGGSSPCPPGQQPGSTTVAVDTMTGGGMGGLVRGTGPCQPVQWQSTVTPSSFTTGGRNSTGGLMVGADKP